METLTMDLIGTALLVGSGLIFVVGLIRLTFWN